MSAVSVNVTKKNWVCDGARGSSRGDGLGLLCARGGSDVPDGYEGELGLGKIVCAIFVVPNLPRPPFRTIPRVCVCSKSEKEKLTQCEISIGFGHLGDGARTSIEFKKCADVQTSCRHGPFWPRFDENRKVARSIKVSSTTTNTGTSTTVTVRALPVLFQYHTCVLLWVKLFVPGKLCVRQFPCAMGDRAIYYKYVLPSATLRGVWSCRFVV